MAELDAGYDTGCHAELFTSLDDVHYRFFVGVNTDCTVVCLDAGAHSCCGCGRIGCVLLDIVERGPDEIWVI